MKTKWKVALALALLWLCACTIVNKPAEVTLQSPTAISQVASASIVSAEYTIRPKSGGTIILASYSQAQVQATVEATLVPTLALPTPVIAPTMEVEETQTVVPEGTVEVSPTETATQEPTATHTLTATPTNTPTNTPTATFTPTNTPTSTPTPTPTNTPTPTFIPYDLKWTNSVEGLNPGQYFLAPQQCNPKRDIGIWIRVQPKAVDWPLTIKMWNVTLAQGWRTYTDVYTGKLTTTFDEASQFAVVTVPAGTSEFMLEFGSNKSCAYMGVEGKVTDAPPVAAPTSQPAAILPSPTFIQPSLVPPTPGPFDGQSNI